MECTTMKRNVRSKDDVTRVLKSVLVSHKNSLRTGMPVAQLDMEYREQDGIRIPFRELGYPSLMDFLESLQRSNEIIIEKKGSVHVIYPRVNEQIAHVSALVSRQRDSCRRHSRAGRRPLSRSYPKEIYKPPKLDSKLLADVVTLVKRAPNGMPVKKVIEYLQDRRIYSVDRYNFVDQFRDVSREIFIDNDMIYPITKNEQISRTNTTNGYSSEKRTARIRDTGVSNGDNDDIFVFVKDAKENKRVSSNSQRIDIHEESKSVTTPIDVNTNDCHRDYDNSHAATDDDFETLVNDRTKFRLEKLIQLYPNGIWCAELPGLYHMEYGTPLNYEDHGFTSVSDFAAHLPEIFHCVRLRDKGDFKLFNAKAPKPEERVSARPEHLSLSALQNVYQSYYDEVEAVPVSLSSTISEKLVPEGVMTVGETVAQIFVTELFPDESHWIDVVVVDVVTPSLFWIHLFKKTVKFHRFMTELDEFYTRNASKYIVPIVLLQKGLNCACIYDNKWHRAVIKTVKPDNTVTLMFYDYGTILSYPPQDIHFLHRSFSSLPAQAIPCGLYNVKPKNATKWTKSVCQEFVTRVFDIPLVAMLGSLDADNNSMLIGLTDTGGATDVHINDWMVDSGFAVYGKMVCIRPPNYPFRRFLECEYDVTFDREKKTSNAEDNIVRLAENCEIPDNSVAVSGETVENLSFYDKLLKLHRKSGNKSIGTSSKINNVDSELDREQSRLSHAKKSQTIKMATDRQFFNSKNFGTNLLEKLCKAHSNHMTEINDSNSCNNDSNGDNSSLSNTKSIDSSSSASLFLPNCKNTNLDEKRVIEIPENRVTFKRNANLLKLISSSSSSAYSSKTSSNIILPDCKDTHVERKPVNEFPRNTLELNKNGRLLKLVTNGLKLQGSANSNESATSSNSSLTHENTRDKPSNLVDPLHLRDEIPERRDGASEFGEIYSAHGGHGRMKSIDWNKIRKPVNKSSDKSKGKSLGRISSTPLENNSQSSDSVVFQEFQKFERNSSNTDFETSKLDRVTPQANEKASMKREAEMLNPDENIKGIHNRETQKLKEISKLPPAKKAFLNFVIQSNEKKQALPEFGDFRSSLGGNGRMEPIAWNEFHKVVKSPEKLASSNVAAKSMQKMPVVLKPARKAFLNVINSGFSTTNEREILCLPEGNIKRQTDISPTMRMILKNLNEERGDKQLRLYIPDDVAELLRNGDETDDLSSSADSGKTTNFDIILTGSEVKSSVKYQSLGSLGTSVDRNSSVPANTDGESSVANDKNSDFYSTNNAFCIASENYTNSAEKLLNSSGASDTQDTSRVSTSEDIELEEKDDKALTKSEDRKESDGNDKRVDSVVANVSGLRSLITNASAGELPELQTTYDDLETESIRNDEKLSNKNELAQLATDKDSISDCPSKLSPRADKNTNVWIQSASEKPNSTLLTNIFKLIDVNHDSTDDSDLDSDDLSSDEFTKKNDSSKFEDDTNKKDSPRLEISAKKVEKPVIVIEKSHQVCQELNSSTQKLNYWITENEEPKNSEEKTDEVNAKTKNSEDFEKSVSLPKKIDENSLQLSKKMPRYAPVYDDTCEASDSDEWDFSPSRGLPQIEPSNQLPQLNGIPKNHLESTDSSSDESSVDHLIEYKQKDILSDDNLTDENQTIDCDKHLISTDESIEDNPDDDNNDSLKVSNLASYSILNEVQKSNISAATDVFVNISSSDSSSLISNSNNESYTKSLLRAFKLYL